MQRFAILPMLFASACIGELTGGDDPKPEPPMPQPPEPVTDVQLKVREGSLPINGVKVIFQNADDSVIADVTTDATGLATTKMPNGGNVTVIRTYGPDVYGQPGPIDHVYTYVGVKPGDTIELVGDTRDETPVSATLNVGLTNGEFVYVRTPCGEGYGHAPMIPISLKGCGSETDFFVVNYSGETDDDGTNSGPLYFAAHAPVASTIDFSGEIFRGTLSTEYSASNMMMPDGSVAVQKRLVLGTFTMFDSGVQGPTATTDVPELPNSEQLVSAYVSHSASTQVISVRDAFSPTPTTIDVAANMIKTSSAPAIANNTITWTEAGSGAPDLAIAHVTVGAVGRQFTRSIAAPYAGSTMRVPALPAAHDKYNVQATDTPDVMHSLVRVTGGYDGARARVFNQGLADIAPMGGIATASFYVSAQTDPPKP